MTRRQPRTEGSLALKLDFGTDAIALAASAAPAQALRLAGPPDKYAALEHRRRQAQIVARRLLELDEVDQED